MILARKMKLGPKGTITSCLGILDWRCSVVVFPNVSDDKTQTASKELFRNVTPP